MKTFYDLGELVNSLVVGMKTVVDEGKYLLQEADYFLFYLSSFRRTSGWVGGSMAAAAAAFFGGCGPQECEISRDCDTAKDVCSSANICVDAKEEPEEACGDSILKGKIFLRAGCSALRMIYFRQRDCASVTFGPPLEDDQLDTSYWEAPEATFKAFQAAGNTNLDYYGYRSGVLVALYPLSSLNDIFRDITNGMEITDLTDLPDVRGSYKGLLALGLNPFVDLNHYPSGLANEKGVWSWEGVEQEFRRYVESELPHLSDPYHDFRLPGEQYVVINGLLTKQMCEDLRPDH